MARAMAAAGIPVSQIAAVVGCTGRTVYNMLKEEAPAETGAEAASDAGRADPSDIVPAREEEA